ncbi:MAG: urease accessory protein UreE [Desulfobacterales bacterium]|nr:urease accessory protein UreE [Desulfobacterales bacterium]
MIRLTKKLQGPGKGHATLTLPWEQRTRSRLRVVLDNGVEAGLFLERGTILRGGDLLAAEDGMVVRVQAADEPLSSVICDDALKMARVCYHLGNRHTALEISAGEIRYLRDPVLDALVQHLGLSVQHIAAPFEPEVGAYAGHGHSHD